MNLPKTPWSRNKICFPCCWFEAYVRMPKIDVLGNWDNTNFGARKGCCWSGLTIPKGRTRDGVSLILAMIVNREMKNTKIKEIPGSVPFPFLDNLQHWQLPNSHLKRSMSIIIQCPLRLHLYEYTRYLLSLLLNMFKKTSRTKNIRRKVETTDDEPVEAVIQKTATSSKKKVKSKKSLNALSFAQDEEEGDGEEFQIKKTKSSRTLHVKLPEYV